jgi:hypothetical protein
MITCYLRYQLDPDKLADFEAYGAMWLELLPRFGGIHHGYFLPSEGESDVALAMFSFPSLAAYETVPQGCGRRSRRSESGRLRKTDALLHPLRTVIFPAIVSKNGLELGEKARKTYK